MKKCFILSTTLLAYMMLLMYVSKTDKLLNFTNLETQNLKMISSSKKRKMKNKNTKMENKLLLIK